MSTVVRVDVPDAVNVVNAPVLGTDAPTVAPSNVPPLISAVAATKDVLALSVVNVPATGVAEPITALSIAPELRSTDVIVVVPTSVDVPVTVKLLFSVALVNVAVVGEEAPKIVPSILPALISTVAIVAVPCKCRSLNLAEFEPKSISLVVTGTITPSWKRTCSTAAEDTSTNTPTLLFDVSITTLFSASTSPISGMYPPSPVEPSCLCPLDAANASRSLLYSALIGAARSVAVGTMSAIDCLT